MERESTISVDVQEAADRDRKTPWVAMSTNSDGCMPLIKAATIGDTNAVLALIAAGHNVNEAQPNSSAKGATALYMAAQKGHAATVALLLKSGAKTDIALESDGRTPIWQASQNGHIDVVVALVRAKADVNCALITDGATPLFIASQKDHPHVVTALLNGGADVNRATITGCTPLYVASELNHPAVVNLLLASGADSKRARSDGGIGKWTPMFIAHVKGHAKVSDLLVKAGGWSPAMLAETICSAEGIAITTDREGRTPLYWAAAKGKVGAAKALIAARCDIDAEPKNLGWAGLTPIYIAAQAGHSSVLAVLIAAGAQVDLPLSVDGRTPLWQAAQNGHAYSVKLLASAGADFDRALTSDKSTPLHIASKNEHVDVVIELLAARARPDIVSTADITTPLYISVEKNNCELAKVLLDAGANPNVALNGRSPLWQASHNGHSTIVSALLASEADVDLCTSTDGASPLYVAASKGHVDVVEILLSANATVDQVRTTDGTTPLCVASQKGHAAVVDILVAEGAQVDLARSSGVTPLYVAAEKGHVKVVSALLSAGADIQKARTDGGNGEWTALFIATNKGHTQVVSLIKKATTLPLRKKVATGTGMARRKAKAMCEAAGISMVRDQEGRTALYVAAEREKTDIAAQLIAGGHDVNMARTDEMFRGVGPLYIASFYGNEKLVSILVSAGAALNQLRLTDGATPLFIAACQGHSRVVAALAAAGAEVNRRLTTDGRTPLWQAAQNGHEETITELISNGADVNLHSNTSAGGSSPLYIAAQKGHIASVTLLTSAKARVDEPRTTDGATPLHVAVYAGHSKVVAALLTAGAKVDIAAGSAGSTPLLKASQNGHVVIVDLLLKARASVDLALTDGIMKHGCTPLYSAAKEGHSEVVAQLLAAGADAAALTENGHSALNAAASDTTPGHIECLHLLQNVASLDLTISLRRKQLRKKTQVKANIARGGNKITNSNDIYNVRDEKSDVDLSQGLAVSDLTTPKAMTTKKKKKKKKKKLPGDGHKLVVGLPTEDSEFFHTVAEDENDESESNENTVGVEPVVPMVRVSDTLEFDRVRPLAPGASVFPGRYRGKRVAVKVTLVSKAALHEREVDVYRALRDHPNVCKYEDEQSDGNNSYLVMELCNRTLAEHVHSPEFSMTSDRIRANFNHGIVEGLAHVHAADLDDEGLRVCHFDLHPGNILCKASVSSKVLGGWQPKIADMGLGKVLGSHERSSFAIDGMAPVRNEWRAPEVFDLLRHQRVTVTKKVDVFSAGLLLFYVGTGGQHPYARANDFPGEIEIRIAKREEPGNMGALVSFPPQLGQTTYRIELRHLVETMLSENPMNRPSMDEVSRHVYFFGDSSRAGLIKAAKDAGALAWVQLERRRELAIGPGEWTDVIDGALLSEMHDRRIVATGGRKYRGSKLYDLVSASRNLIEHLHEYSADAIEVLLSTESDEERNVKLRQGLEERKIEAKEATVVGYISTLFPGLMLQLALILSEKTFG